MNKLYTIRTAKPDEFVRIGRLMVEVYSQLEGFPKPDEQPAYYDLLANIGKLTEKPGVELLVAVNDHDDLGGAVVYFGDMTQYGAQGVADHEKEAAGFRLLAVGPQARGQGLGKLLTRACIDKAKDSGKEQVIIHSTEAMRVAWQMYEKTGFKRAEDLDFLQEDFPVFGFRLPLT